MSAQTYPAPRGAYPARLEGRLDPSVSRWLWLVKWVLVIPHVFVLAFLWVAAWVLTVVAGFAILFTGRYPPLIFEFNVGVMRWTWRVMFYAIGGFATDRYPPFTLESDPSYPADFNVAYPEHLSRGLVLVKWWLLAIPQYLIVAIFAGGWGMGGNGGGWGLIGLLALVAAVVLAFTGRYPEQMFDLVMGLNRWCYRVLAYAALLRDEYPPFRLDMGGRDPGTPVAAAPVPHGPALSPGAPSAAAPASPADHPVGAPAGGETPAEADGQAEADGPAEGNARSARATPSGAVGPLAPGAPPAPEQSGEDPGPSATG